MYSLLYVSLIPLSIFVKVVRREDNRYEKQYVSLKPALQTFEQTNLDSNASSTPELPPRASTYDEIEFEPKVKERYLNSDSSSSNISEYEPLSNVKDNIPPPRGTEYMVNEAGVSETLRIPDSIAIKDEMECHGAEYHNICIATRNEDRGTRCWPRVYSVERDGQLLASKLNPRRTIEYNIPAWQIFGSMLCGAELL